VIDPEDYSLANSVFVSAVDLTHLPTNIYRTQHEQQFWLFYSEESPRNSYRLLPLIDLDRWFNLTATLKPESDFPIQYRVDK
jgi:hypothetical protein